MIWIGIHICLRDQLTKLMDSCSTPTADLALSVFSSLGFSLLEAGLREEYSDQHEMSDYDGNLASGGEFHVPREQSQRSFVKPPPSRIWTDALTFFLPSDSSTSE
jgi:hypothetical protein